LILSLLPPIPRASGIALAAPVLCV